MDDKWTQIFRNLPDRIPQRILFHSPKILVFTRDRAVQTQTATNQLLFHLHLSQLEALLFNGLPSHDWHHTNVLQHIPIHFKSCQQSRIKSLHSLSTQNSKNSSWLHKSKPAAGSWGLGHDNRQWNVTENSAYQEMSKFYSLIFNLLCQLPSWCHHHSIWTCHKHLPVTSYFISRDKINSQTGSLQNLRYVHVKGQQQIKATEEKWNTDSRSSYNSVSSLPSIYTTMKWTGYLLLQSLLSWEVVLRCRLA
jgi:hypothetical protein